MMTRPLWVAVLWLITAAAALSAPQAPVITAAAVDTPNCGVWRNGQAGQLDVPRMLYALGATNTVDAPWRPWTAGSVTTETAAGDTFHYRVAFKQPVSVGAVLATVDQVSFLKPEAAYPGDPADAAQWVTVSVPPALGPRLLPLDATLTTRVVLFTDRRKAGHSALGPVRLYGERYFNVAQLAGARAKTEYHAPENIGGSISRASDVVRGRGTWVSAGVNEKGNFNTPVVSDIYPQWYVFGWEAPHTLSALYLNDNFGDLKLDAYNGPAGITALAGVESEWTRIKPAQYHTTVLQGRWLVFDPPVRTTGIRLRISKALDARGADTPVARLDALLAFEDLQAAPRPAVITEPPPPPLAISYQAPLTGFLTLAIDDAQGVRVRNLFAREERAQGEHREPWDLADELGKFVGPGTYHWKAITAPALELRYEQTTYPNVTVNHPENSAWLNGPDGPGGWLADHSPPRSGCAADDMLFFGAPVSESGIGFAATDLSGRKQWGISSFSAWSSGNSMCTDGKQVYVQHAGFGAYGSPDEGADRVWAVDIATHAWRNLLVAQNSETRRRGIAGMAAREGKLVLAINAVDNWLANACGWNVVDVTNCRPQYREARKPKFPYEIVPDPQDDFLRLLRLKGTPPGYGTEHGLTYLESSRGPGRRNYVLLAFNKPVQIGTCVFPVPQGAEYRVRLSVLKADAPYPPNPGKREQWQDFAHQATLAWDVALAPPNCLTRALLISFIKGDDDALSDLIDGGGDAEPEAPGGGDLLTTKDAGTAALTDRNAWIGQLEGMRLLRRRYSNLFGTATVRVNSGKVAPDGTWDAARTEPLTKAAPAIYLMEWKEPQAIRGLAIKEIDASLTEIDAYTGPAGAPVELTGDANWEKVGQYVPDRRTNHSGFAAHNALARYLDSTVDFGRVVTTRALRLRAIAQFTTSTHAGSCAKDMLGLDPARCRIFGVAPLQYLGGEAPVDATVAERLEIVNGTSGKIEREVPIKQPSELAYAPDGTLYGLSAGALVKVDLAGAKHTPLTLDVKQPGALTCDKQGNLYVFDRAPDQRVVKVFDPAGKLLRQVGEAGGYQVGPWNPNRLQDVTALAADREGKLWCVDTTYWPKRISCWGPDGKFLREYLGPTQYGGAGVLDPGDKTRMFYGPLEFALDWTAGTSRLKNLTWDPQEGWAAGEVPIRVNDRVYLVNRPSDSQFTMSCGIVYLYERDHLRRVAAVGHAAGFGALQNPDVMKGLGKRVLADLQVIWTDRNGDGIPQYSECEFTPAHTPSLTPFDGQLATQAGPWRFSVKEFLPDGVPVFQEQKLPLPYTPGYQQGLYYRLNNGTFYRYAANGPEACFSAAGKQIWTYKEEGAGVGPDRSCGPYSPGQVVCQFSLVGHETAPQGDLGEFYVINTNFGVWNLWTADGLLAGRLFRDLRDGQRLAWTMKEHERGMRLDDITPGQEHFNGWFCRSISDGKYYAVAGHNHASVVEVAGIEKFKRLGGDLTVTPEDVAKAQAWAKDVVVFQAKAEAKVLDCYSTEGLAAGSQWETMPSAALPGDKLNPGRTVSFQMCHDQKNLYLRWYVRGAGPFKNTGAQWDRLFKTGACVDLMLGLQPDADPLRRAPVAGDKRVLIAMLKNKPTVVLYDAVVPGAPKDQHWDAVSPVGHVEFDQVRVLNDASAQYTPIIPDPNFPQNIVGHILEATLPLATIGLTPKPGTRIKFDWGILETDASGSAVLSRSYWANKASSTLADVPTEARLEPNLWGWALFPGRNQEAPSLDDPKNSLDPRKSKDPELDLEEK